MADAVEILHSKINPQICGNRHQNHHLFHHRRISNVSPIRSSKYGGVSSSSVGRGYPSPKPNSQFGPERSSPFSSAGTEFHGEKRGNLMVASATQMKAGLIGKATQKWWKKGSELSNMKEVNGAQDLVDSLLNAGDKLVVVDFFSPGCGGCKALHPKICQFAEMNPNVEFLQVNYEEHKSMCYSLNVHVLPFFRFYRGAHGRLCSFSCTNATIKKFKDALARHSPDRCSLGPPRGLEEKELLALSSNSDLSFSYIPPKPVLQPVYPSSGENERSEEPATTSLSSPNPLSTALPSTQGSEEKDLVFAGR